MSKEDRKSIFFGVFLCVGILGLFSVMLFTPKSRGDGKQEIQLWPLLTLVESVKE